MSFSGLDPARARHHVLRTIRQGFLGESRAAVTVREQIADFLARHRTQQPPPPILLRGEVGVGKSLLARLIHRAGPRPDGPFVEFHCAAIPDTLLEAELFGDERGALTAAPHAKPGAFQAANHGTLFLDLVTALPEAIQAKLLRVIEERSLQRLSSMRDEPLDVWILTATHEDLRAGVDYHRRYREAFNLQEPYVIESLYQHLGQLDLLIPPLRQRPEDILLLAEHSLARVCAERHLSPKVFAADARSALLANSWPGNVREVKALMERVALVFAENDVAAFSDTQIALLRTFADQAVIAIENVRLFKELEMANRELAAASQHKSEFLASMSHELRTPLNAIIGFSEVLSDRMFGELNEKQEEYLKDIYASGTHLLSLINDILDLSKIEAGRMELEVSDFDLPTALDNALMLVRERAGRRSITLQVSIDDRLGEIQGDERKIRQVVLNLLSNAIKFTPEGGRIDVAAVPKDELVEVSVSDTGIGIAPEDQEKVFEEFRQVGTADKKAEGTGLGLTLCRKFIELHGGRIWVKSQVGVGSTFTFTIPVRCGE